MINRLREVISGCYNEVIFTYNDKMSGITSEVENYIPTFQAWHGEEVKEYSLVEDVLSDKFYSGKSLKELADQVDFRFL